MNTINQQPVAWQSIEIAPRDGTAILVMRDIWPGTESGRADDCNGHNTYVAAWWAGEGVAGEWVCYMDQVHEPICPIEPTHWMPLPHAPKDERPPDDTALLRQALEALENSAVKHPQQIDDRNATIDALRKRLGETK